MPMSPNPRRPHPFQINDSRYEVRGPTLGAQPMYEVWELWWFIDRHGEKDFDERWVAAFPDRDRAEAERDRRNAL